MGWRDIAWVDGNRVMPAQATDTEVTAVAEEMGRLCLEQAQE